MEEGEGEGDEGVGQAGGCCRERIDLDDAHARPQVVQSGVVLRIRSDDFTPQPHRADCIPNYKQVRYYGHSSLGLVVFNHIWT